MVFLNTYWVNVNIDFCAFRCKVLFDKIIILRRLLYIAVHLNEKIRNCNTDMEEDNVWYINVENSI